VAITVERLIAVVQPLKVATLSTTRRARLVIALLTLICFVLAAFPLWTVGLSHDDSPTCTRLEHSSYKLWLIAVVVVMTLTLPHCLLVLCTTVIIVFLARSQHFRRNVSRSWTPGFLVCSFLYAASRKLHTSTFAVISPNIDRFLPFDAMLARHVLWPWVCLPACLSQARLLSKRLHLS